MEIEKDNSAMYTFRLNLSNSDHMLIHRTLTNLDPNLYKTMSTFIIDALEKYIKGITPEMLIGSAGDDKNYVTREELEEMKEKIIKEVTREVMKNMYSGFAAAFTGGET